MGRLSTTKAPTESFGILLKHSDGGIKHKHRMKIILIGTGILLILAFLGTITGLSVHLNSKSSVDKLTEDSSHNNESLVETTTTSSTSSSTTTTEDYKSNETLVLIGGKNFQNEFLNEIEVIGQEGCPRLETLPQNYQNQKSLSTLTKDGYLVICTEHLDSIFCHATTGSSTQLEIQVPDLARILSSNSYSTKFRKDYHGITINNDFIILNSKSRGTNAWYTQTIFRADTNSYLNTQSFGISPLISTYYRAHGSCSVTFPDNNYFLLIGGYNPYGEKVTTQVSVFKYKDGQITNPRFAKGKTVRIFH